MPLRRKAVDKASMQHGGNATYFPLYGGFSSSHAKPCKSLGGVLVCNQLRRNRLHFVKLCQVFFRWENVFRFRAFCSPNNVGIWQNFKKVLRSKGSKFLLCTPLAKYSTLCATSMIRLQIYEVSYFNLA